MRCTLFVLALAVAAGCSTTGPGENTPSAAAEASLAEQATAVREGKSTQVRLDQSLVRDKDLAALDGLEDTLLRVNFSRTEITDAGLAHLGRFKQLEQLRLASERVTDDGLANLARLDKLRFLHLLDMPIGDAGLGHLHGLKSLESLYLDRTRATDAGIARLLEALPGVHLHIDEHHHPSDPHASDHTH